MTTKDFIDQAIGKYVYVIHSGDNGMDRMIRGLIYKKTKLRLIKWTIGGNAYVHDEETNKYYSVRPSTLREYKEIENEK